jgi:flagellin
MLAVDRAAVVTAINNISAQTGVRAVDTGDINKGVNLIADDGRNISLVYGGSLNAKSTGLGSSSVTFLGSNLGAANTTLSTLGATGTNTFKINGVTVTATAAGASLTAAEIVSGITSAGISGLTASATTGTITLTSTSGKYLFRGRN